MSTPISLEISEHVVNDVVIIEFHGPLILPTAMIFRAKIDELAAAGKLNIVFNLHDMPYYDSTGSGDLVSAWVRFNNIGASLKFCGVRRNVRNAFEIQKLSTIFDIYDSEADALGTFIVPSSLGYPRYFECPSCGSASRPGWRGEASRAPSEQACPKCDAHFVIKGRQNKQDPILITQLRVPTYEHEYFELVTGRPYVVRVVGRLSLFSASALDRVWEAIPLRRRVVFDLDFASTIDKPGLEALFAFLETKGKELDAKAVICLEGSKNEELRRDLPQAKDVYLDRETAIAALGDLSGSGAWLARTITTSREF